MWKNSKAERSKHSSLRTTDTVQNPEAAPNTVEIWTTSISLGSEVDAPFACRRRAQ
ncbi:hypothetical protein [Rhizobium leguminosarum]|uniref:hypothetical protein n=1 Tax=Rhizobium leguminosarum TaxID=384 RepID=UPI001AE1D9FC|nr:hypothetical protein [Rhizobium leguminosarum]MBP2444293.1 hypothetical protein [Rhizobium leguminosarum]